ncbi:insulinase family protein [Mycoplasmatota bacterium]|nr:insulinase family protein [Mycoplasmatota bacterium]
MEKMVYDNLKETVYYEKLDNGLEVYMLPKKGFNKFYATFTTKYGSIDNTFIPIGKKDYITVPDGIAHFLEHKMFESESGDAFEKFTEYAANSNAYTAFNRTAYLFSCTSYFEENLNLLLDFVQDPYFTDQNVDKEKNIIAQEISMYDDNPDWQLYFGTIENMFKENGVRVDIAGTEESIYQITKELLYECYNTFYHPANMLLFVVGDMDIDQTIELIRNNQSKKDFKPFEKVEKKFVFESNEVNQKQTLTKMDVSTPKVAVGIKNNESRFQGKELMKYEIALDIIFDYLFSKSSTNYQQLLDDALINNTFSYELTIEYSYGFGIISSDTEKPDELTKRLKDILINARHMKMSEEEFTRRKNKLLGASIKSFNSPDAIANSFTRYKFNGMNMFDAIKEYEKLTLADIEEVLPFFDERAITTKVIMPK